MLALTYAIFSDALAPYLPWLLLALMGTLISTGLVLNAVVGERSSAEAICSAIGEESGRLMGVTASLGVAIFPDHAADPESLLHAADEALYDAKGRGRNQVRIFARRTAKISAFRAKTAKRAHG